MSASDDRELMLRALGLAARGLFSTSPNPRVGCVVARDGRVIGEGWHERAGEAHAEVRALADVKARGESPRGATLYVTLEPCNHHGRTPPCSEAIIAAGVARVVYAMADPHTAAAGGAARLAAAGVRMETGLLEDEAHELNLGWLKRLRAGQPWVRVKVAASLDGRTALQGGESQWITGAEARADGHRWRARACAILTGVGTVLQDDPQLTVRAVETSRQPLKLVIDRRGELPAGARMLAGGPVIVFSAETPRVAWSANVESIVIPGPDGKVDLGAMLRLLAAREMNEVHVEAGAKLNGALLAAGLVDELLIYLAPCLIGDPARGMFDLPVPLQRLASRVRLRATEIVRVGDDWRVLARVGETEG
jgi:diaminohydroxyphosphoribosylaminopyrimidine deaminase / 5-amino-6-(5-phosphoribosylamino)uracil reductase